MTKYEILEYCLIPPPYGGATIHVKRLIEKLREEGHSVGGFYSQKNKENKLLADSSLFYQESHCSSSNKILRAFHHINRGFDHIGIVRNFKVVHYHGLENLELIWIFHKILKKKVLMTVHSSMIENFYRNTSRINRFFLKRLAASDIQWIAVSEEAKLAMQRLPFNFKNEIKVIPAYIPRETGINIPLSESMSRYISLHSKNLTFYAHSFMLNDGVDVYGFEAALRLYSELVKEYGEELGMVLCISDVSESDKMSRLHQLAREYGVDDKIYWQEGPIDNMYALWGHTDVYVRPTSTDGDSIAIREVLEAGRMVVASDVCDRPPGVINYRFGEEEDLIAKVKDALATPRKKKVLNWQPYEEVRGIIESML